MSAVLCALVVMSAAMDYVSLASEPIVLGGSAFEHVTFESGGSELRGVLYLAEGKGLKPTIVSLHGNPGAPARGNNPLLTELQTLGFNVFEFNYRGLWGTPGYFSLSNAIEDFESALTLLRSDEFGGKFSIDPNRISVIGFSFGSSTVLSAAIARNDLDLDAIVTFGPCDHGFFGKESMDSNSKIRSFLDGAIEQLFGDEGLIKQPAEIFVSDIQDNAERYSLPPNASALSGFRLYSLAALDDSVCPIEDHVLPLYRALGPSGLELKVVTDNHSFANTSRSKMALMFADWIHEDQPQTRFFQRLASLCGSVFTAQMPADSGQAFAGQKLTAKIENCTKNQIRISLAADEDRSRTWILSRRDGLLQLKHDHRHEDGTPDEITNYGGTVADEGTWLKQSFPADAETAEMIPEAATNVWRLILAPDAQTLTYRLERHGRERFQAILEYDAWATYGREESRPLSEPEAN